MPNPEFAGLVLVPISCCSACCRAELDGTGGNGFEAKVRDDGAVGEVESAGVTSRALTNV